MNLKLQKIVPQLITVLVVVLVFGFFTYNAQINIVKFPLDFWGMCIVPKMILKKRNKPTGIHLKLWMKRLI